MQEVDIFYETYELDEQQKDSFEKYYQLIHEYNKVMNLTGIDDRPGVYLKHFYDSLLLSKKLDAYKDSKLIGDLGSGAGFPGIVLAIYYPNHNFHLIEPIKKRCNFLDIVVKELGLTNVQVLNKRAEELDKEQYDIIVSRAVSALNILLELSIPLLKDGGVLIAQKGPKVNEEIIESKNALQTLKSSVEDLALEELPIENSTRFNLVVKKNGKTDAKYPRNYGQIKKSPL